MLGLSAFQSHLLHWRWSGQAPTVPNTCSIPSASQSFLDYSEPSAHSEPSFNVIPSNVYASSTSSAPKPTVIRKEHILSVGHLQGLISRHDSPLSPSSSQILTELLEFRLRQIIQEAVKFTKHCYRSHSRPLVTVADIRCALRYLEMPPVLGYSQNSIYRFVSPTGLLDGDKIVRKETRRLTHIINGSQIDKSENLELKRNSTHVKDEDRYHSLLASYHLSGGKLSISKNSRIRLVESVYQDVKRPTPCQPVCSVHWLAVDGQVTALKQNLQYGKAISTSNPDPSFSFHTLPKHDFQMSEATHSQNTFRDATFHTVAYNDRLKNILGKEQKQFLQETQESIRRAMYGTELNQRLDETLQILSTSLGLEQLVPFLCQFFSSMIKSQRESGSVSGVNTILQYAEALIHNPHISLHHYIHQIVHPLLDCVVGYDPFPISSTPQALTIRRISATILGNLARLMRFPEKLLDKLDQVLLQIYRKQLTDPNTSLQSFYGALHGLMALGKDATRLGLIPMLPLLLYTIEVSRQMNMLDIVQTKDENQQQLCELRGYLLAEIDIALLNCLYKELEEQLSILDSSMEVGQDASLIPILKEHTVCHSEALVRYDKLLQMTHLVLNEQALPILSSALSKACESIGKWCRNSCFLYTRAPFSKPNPAHQTDPSIVTTRSFLPIIRPHEEIEPCLTPASSLKPMACPHQAWRHLEANDFFLYHL